MSATSMIVTPRVSEQTYALSTRNVFVFNVPTNANKAEITQAIEAQYEVTVLALRTSVLKGKLKASNKRARQATYGRRSDVKKAFATLKDGDKISVFEEIE